PQRNDWLGQFLYSSPIGALLGGVSASAGADGVYAAWTVGFPRLGKIGVVLAHHGRPVQSSIVLDDAVLAGLALGAAGPVLAATAVVDAGAAILSAGVLRDAGGAAIQPAGAAGGVAAAPAARPPASS